MEYKAKAGGNKEAIKAALNQAKGIFQQFVDKAQGKAEYDGAVKRSKERMQDIDDTITFINAGIDEKNAPPPDAKPADAAGAADKK